MALLSSSDNPPQTPESCPLSSAHCKHGSRTSHFAQTFLASSIWAIAGPVFPTGKKSSGSTWRQAALWRQSALRSTATPSRLGAVQMHSCPIGRVNSLAYYFDTQEFPKVSWVALMRFLNKPTSIEFNPRSRPAFRRLSAKNRAKIRR